MCRVGVPGIDVIGCSCIVIVGLVSSDIVKDAVVRVHIGCILKESH